MLTTLSSFFSFPPRKRVFGSIDLRSSPPGRRLGQLLGNGAEIRHEVPPKPGCPPRAPAGPLPAAPRRGGGGSGRVREHERAVAVVTHERGAGADGINSESFFMLMLICLSYFF